MNFAADLYYSIRAALNAAVTAFVREMRLARSIRRTRRHHPIRNPK